MLVDAGLEAAQGLKNVIHGGDHPWRRTLAVAGFVIGLASAFGGPEMPSTSITQPGQATIDELTLYPGIYCDGAVEVQVNDVEATYSWEPGYGIFHSPIHSTVSETGNIEVTGQVCMKVSGLHKAVRNKEGNYVINLFASSNPNKSDFELIEYPKNPVDDEKFTPSGNWLDKTVTAAYAPLDANLNLIPGVNLGGTDGLDDTLKAIDELQADYDVALKCGDEIVDRLSSTTIPGGNMEKSAVSGMLKTIPPGYQVPKANQFIFRVSSDKTGLPNQYSDIYRSVAKQQGFSLSTASQIPKCNDIAGKVKHSEQILS